MKDFDQWNSEKKKTDSREDMGDVYFSEREVWWVRLGVNIGFEQDGTGEGFERPVVILKKYNPNTLLVLPLSTTQKRGKYYCAVGKVEERDAVAIVSQIRLLDSKRLVNSAGTIDKETFARLIKAVVDTNFGGYI